MRRMNSNRRTPMNRPSHMNRGTPMRLRKIRANRIAEHAHTKAFDAAGPPSEQGTTDSMVPPPAETLS